MKNGYRQDIDGLRAVSVIAVFLFHLYPKILKSGYIGVDIFFVISGYVVTLSLLQKENRNFGKFASDFYLRRLRRLFPALAFVILVSTIVFCTLIPPFPNEQVIAVYRTAFTSLIGLSNFYILRVGSNYFDGDELRNPFLHTWSLGVEEQFYIIFPILIFFSAKFSSNTKDLNKCKWTIILFSIVSLVICVFLSSRNAALNYYLMPTRFWELGAGAVLALRRETRSKIPKPEPAILNINTSHFLAVILLGLLLATNIEIGFPFPWGIPVVFATMILIGRGPNRGYLVSNFLELPALTHLGRLSYSIYLWHYPVIFFYEKTLGLQKISTFAFAVLTTYLLSYFTYRFIETPFRTSYFHKKSATFYGIGSIAILVFCILLLVQSNRTKIYLGPHEQWDSEWHDRSVSKRLFNGGQTSECHLGPGADLDGDFCVSAKKRAGLSTLFAIGDSHSYANWPMFEGLMKKNEYQLKTLSHDGCGPRKLNNIDLDSCSKYWVRVKLELIEKLQKSDVVMLSMFSRSYKSQTGFLNLITEIHELVNAKDATLVVQAPLPSFSNSATNCLETWMTTTPENCHKPRIEDQRERRESLNGIVHLGIKFKDIYVWDPFDYLCPNEICSHFSKGKPFYRDDDHLSTFGSRALAEHFVEFISSIRPDG